MKIAVVGSGVSGLAATWLLNEHSDHEVHLYESDSRPGGHANTVHFVPKGKTQDEGVDVDTYIVFNPTTYPNFLRFLRLYSPKTRLQNFLATSWFLGRGTTTTIDQKSSIRILPTEMTFSISRDRGAFEWAGKNLATVFCQPRRLVDPDMWRMIYDVLRFNVCSRRVLLDEKDAEDISIGEYLSREGYSDAFKNNYLIPMTAAIWSTPPDNCFLDFPARTLIQFMYNHHLLQITGKPSWLTIQGGSYRYVNAILSKLPQDQLHLNSAVQSVRNVEREDGGNPQVILTTIAGHEVKYDHVIFACHSDAVLNILRVGGLTDEEDRILSLFAWNKNEAVLHSDTNLMPRSRMAWSCWNYLSSTTPVSDEKGGNGYNSGTEDEDGQLYSPKSRSPVRPIKMEINEVSLQTDGMNDLQHIPESRYGPVLVTLNPPFEPSEDTIVGRWQYDHPVLDSKAVKAQNEMYKIQNTRSISYAGAYLKYGFHEDGFTSGLLAACSIDDDQKSLPTAMSYTSNLCSMTIPTRRLTVRPPFDIQHADHHVRLARRGSENFTYKVAAWIFDWLEKSGVRPLLGMAGSVLLGVLTWLLGINTF
ncbi:amine oxidase [Gymnopilus junonius]|uniref:Amine oxidase n=1 Tax=Gymnopilus junonius TaxID=109634 RepID=A0A9P5ND20_GYMJU|nr:amine oxidase [Gymnopilus junonius]